jgi:hypothetical protein
MTDIAFYEYERAVAEQAARAANSTFEERVPLMMIPFVLPVLFCGISWMAEGIPILTDVGFMILTAICVTGMLFEIRAFPKRFGVGGMVMYGGILIWYCNDYFSHWFNLGSFDDQPYSAATVAKAGFFTCLFILCAMTGLALPPWRRIGKMVRSIPEPPSSGMYVVVIAVAFFIGLIPLLFFTVEPFYVAIWKSIIGMRTGEGAVFTMGRTGNYNYSWGGYLAQVQQIGGVAGLLGGFYLVVVPGSLPGKIFCAGVWLFWSAMAFGTGSRGEFLYAVLPVVSLIFIKYMIIGREQLGRFSQRAVLYTGLAVFAVLIVVKIQGQFRNTGLQTASLEQVQLFVSDGNSMFSAGLLGYQSFPDPFPHPSDNFSGAAYVRPIPDEALRFAIGWIPRVLWNSKPGISSTGQWYNKMLTGGAATDEDTHGGTVSASISGGAYIYFGWPGVVEMGLLFGWMCRCVEVCLRASLHRPMGLMFSLGLAAYMFRSYRDLTPHNFYPLMIGTTVISGLIFFTRMTAGLPALEPAEGGQGTGGLEVKE